MRLSPERTVLSGIVAFASFPSIQVCNSGWADRSAFFSETEVKAAGVISPSQALAIFSPLFPPPLLTFSTRCDRLSANAAGGDEGGTAPRPWLAPQSDRPSDRLRPRNGRQACGEGRGTRAADGSREGGGNPLSVVVGGVVVSVLIPERARDCRSAVGRSVGRSLVRLWRRVPFLPQDK